MTAPRLSDVLSSGAGMVDYAWHVAGFPYVATSSAKLATYLSGLSALNAGIYFGEVGSGIGEHKLSGHLEYLPILDISSTRWSWSHDDAEGLSGGDWQVRILESHSGRDWSVVSGESPLEYSLITSAPVFCVPGISQIFDSSNDTYIRVGEIADDISYDDTTIKIKDIRGLGKYLTTIPLDGAVLWIGHEAILVDSAVDNEDGTYSITVNANGRGLWRSRKQPHAENEYSARSEFVATAPIGGIAGRPSTLWAFASGDGGSTYGVGTLVCHGKISQGISIKDGIATIKCESPLGWLKSPSSVYDYSGQLKRFVLQRGQVGTSETSDYGPAGSGSHGLQQSAMRAPHLVIYEKNIVDGDYEEQVVNIWLCEKNSYRVFDTVDELLAAIQLELDYLSDSSASQFSGDNTAGNDRQSLWFPYTVTREGIAVDKKSTNYDWWTDGGSGSFVLAKQAMVSGVIPTVFGLSHPKSSWLATTGPVASWKPVSNENLRRDEIARRLANPGEYYSALGDRSAYFKAGPIGTYTGSLDDLSHGYLQHIPPIDMISDLYADAHSRLEKKVTGKIKDYKASNDYFPRYYYEAGRDDDMDPALGANGFDPGQVWGVPQTDSGKPRLWLERIEGHQPVVGSVISLCDVEGEPRWNGQIDASGEDGEYFYVDISSTPPGIAAYAMNLDDSVELPPKGRYHVISWIYAQSSIEDPNSVSQGIAPVSSDDAVELLAASVGGSYSIVLDPSQELYWAPEVGAISDSARYSWIDWADLRDKLDPVLPGERYLYRPSDKSFWDSLRGILQSHGLIPYLELVNEVDYSLWQMRFRPIGVVNYSDAVMYRRGINATIFTDDYGITRDVASGFVYSGMKISLNYDGGEFGAVVEIKDKSAYAQNGYAGKIYEIEDRITQCSRLKKLATDVGIQSAVAEIYTSAILPHVSKPRPISTANCTSRAWLLPVGGDAIVTDAYGRNPFSGSIGYADLPGLVTGISVSLDSLKTKASWRLARNVSKGWAPALYMPGGCLTETSSNVWDVALSGGNAASDHEFSGASDPVDWSRFDCWDYDRITGEYVERACACEDYCVRIFRPDRPLDTIWYGTASVTGLEDGGTPTMTLAIIGELPTAFPMILEFGAYDDAETCQRELSVALCNDNGEIGDGEFPCDVWS